MLLLVTTITEEVQQFFLRFPRKDKSKTIKKNYFFLVVQNCLHDYCSADANLVMRRKKKKTRNLARNYLKKVTCTCLFEMIASIKNGVSRRVGESMMRESRKEIDTSSRYLITKHAPFLLSSTNVTCNQMHHSTQQL